VIATLGLSAQSPDTLSRELRGSAQQVYKQYLSGYDAHSALEHLIEAQHALKAATPDPRLQNLLKYIDLSIRQIRKELKRPFSEKNADELSDAVEAIDEAARYILRNRTHRVLVASR